MVYRNRHTIVVDSVIYSKSTKLQIRPVLLFNTLLSSSTIELLSGPGKSKQFTIASGYLQIFSVRVYCQMSLTLDGSHCQLSLG